MKPSLLYKCLSYYDDLKIPDGVFDITNINDYTRRFIGGNGESGRQMMEVQHRLPYPECWFEYSATAYLNGDLKGETNRINCGMYVVENKSNHTIEFTVFSTNIINISFPLILGNYILYFDEHFYPLDCTASGYCLSSDNRIDREYKKFGANDAVLKKIEDLHEQLSNTGEWAAKGRLQIDKEMSNYRINLGMAIKFLNCKNIDIIDNIDKKELKKRKRKNKPFYEVWKTLKVTGAGVSKEKKEHQGNFNPLHICRGHFKTFTDEKPLLGKHIGTYWWADQVRGDRKIGIVNKDYELASN